MTGIRCDANSIIASGHMMRCLTIAKELVRLGEAVTFFVADDESKAMFDAYVGDRTGQGTTLGGGSNTDIPVINAAVLGTNWQDMESELEFLIPELGKRNVDRLLIDSYKVTVTYFKKLKEVCPVAYLDDLNEATYPVDMLINYSGYYKSLRYEEAYRNVCGHNSLPTKLLLGLSYAPLREQFYSDPDAESGRQEAPNGAGKADKKSISVLLTSGGADTRGMLLATLKASEGAGLVDGNVYWNVVVGSLVKDAESIFDFAKEHHNVKIHQSVTDMAGLMRGCDVAICAAGTMLTECAAIGLPAVFYQVADNQKYNVDYWKSTGGMRFAGDVTGGCESDFGDKAIKAKRAAIEKTCLELNALLADKAQLEEMRKNLGGITDGRGAKRIAQELLAL